MTRCRTVMPVGGLVLVLVLGGCFDRAKPVSEPGTALLKAAKGYGTASDAVSFRVQAGGRNGSDEMYARRGDDSLYEAEYGDGGRNEVRRISGTVFAKADLELSTGQEPPWIRIDPGADQPIWLTLLGDDLVAPTPREATAILTSDVERVYSLTNGDAGLRRLGVVPLPVENGERPTSIAVRRAEPAIIGRAADLYSNGERIARRTYFGARWRDRVPAITAPDGAVAVEVVRDPQAAGLPADVLRAPAALPAGWSLRAVAGITPPQGDGTCQQVLTLYAPTGRSLATGYLAVYLKPVGCETPLGKGAARFTAGPNSGWVGADGDATVGGLTVDGVSVRFRTSLPPAELSTVLASWKPLALG